MVLFKDYIKIFLITTLIQITGFLMMSVFDDLLSASIAVSSFVIAIVVSMAVGIFMGIKRGKNLKQKLLMTLLMPTNYTWLVCIVAVILFVSSIVDILTNLSRNFG